jgi:hypothetical protein
LNLKFIVGDFGNAFDEIFAAAVERIEGLRPTRRQPPLYFWIRLRNRRRCNRTRGETDATDLQEITTLHFASPPCFCRYRPPDDDLMSSSRVYRWPVLDCCLGMWAPKPGLLVFDAINFPALWT